MTLLSAGFCRVQLPLKSLTQPTELLVAKGLQGHSQSDLFSPQARWGDDGARWVMVP